LSCPPDEFEDMQGVCLSAVFPNIEARNIAVSGTTSLQHFEHIKKLKPYPSDVLGIVVMTTGGNDIIHDYGRSPPREGAMYGATSCQARPWITAYEKRLDDMVNTLQQIFPGGCHIFLANIYDPSDGSDDLASVVPWIIGLDVPSWKDGAAILHEYNKVIERCAEKHPSVYLVDIHSELMGHGVHFRKFWRSTYRPEDPHFWYQLILEDPNERGYDAIRRLFLLEMIEVFSPANAPPEASD
jgi:hypothetical protein